MPPTRTASRQIVQDLSIDILRAATSCITPFVDTASGSLRMRMTGDTLGSTNLYLQHRNGINGLLVHVQSNNPAIDLADIILRGSTNIGGTGGGSQCNVRYENRLSEQRIFENVDGEIQFVPTGISSSEPPYFGSGRRGTFLKERLFIYGADSGFNGFEVPYVAGSTLWTLPINDGLPNSFLRTDGNANLSWGTPIISSNLAHRHGAVVY